VRVKVRMRQIIVSYSQRNQVAFRSPLSGIKGQGTPKVRSENNPMLLVKLEEGLFDGPLLWQIRMVFLSRASDWVSEEYKFSLRRSLMHYLSVLKRTSQFSSSVP